MEYRVGSKEKPNYYIQGRKGGEKEEEEFILVLPIYCGLSWDLMLSPDWRYFFRLRILYNLLNVGTLFA